MTTQNINGISRIQNTIIKTITGISCIKGVIPIRIYLNKIDVSSIFNHNIVECVGFNITKIESLLKPTDK